MTWTCLGSRPYGDWVFIVLIPGTCSWCRFMAGWWKRRTMERLGRWMHTWWGCLRWSGSLRARLSRQRLRQHRQLQLLDRPLPPCCWQRPWPRCLSHLPVSHPSKLSYWQPWHRQYLQQPTLFHVLWFFYSSIDSKYNSAKRDNRESSLISEGSQTHCRSLNRA